MFDFKTMKGILGFFGMLTVLLGVAHITGAQGYISHFTNGAVNLGWFALIALFPFIAMGLMGKKKDMVVVIGLVLGVLHILSAKGIVLGDMTVGFGVWALLLLVNPIKKVLDGM